MHQILVANYESEIIIEFLSFHTLMYRLAMNLIVCQRAEVKIYLAIYIILLSPHKIFIQICTATNYYVAKFKF